MLRPAVYAGRVAGVQQQRQALQAAAPVLRSCRVKGKCTCLMQLTTASALGSVSLPLYGIAGVSGRTVAKVRATQSRIRAELRE